MLPVLIHALAPVLPPMARAFTRYVLAVVRFCLPLLASLAGTSLSFEVLRLNFKGLRLTIEV
jgi:hypothetical protein